ncbi:DEAD/DEAH box helicase [Thiomonas sp.]|jgi:superfamily II DNA/RNA helicase|uniref:DEAD-box ATP-dependent RNA helicase RhpA n=1 Tax=Thiomonas intermedia (strain K12) TaxID=75379 RepID=D5X6G3_THIK1|nr:DEAD/DEAH box helicase [Thiomonas sp.]
MNTTTTPTEDTPQPERFSDLALDARILRAVSDMGYEKLTPIQAKAIPLLLDGRDIMGAAQTGTGKTAAFSLPILQQLLPLASTSVSPARHPVRALMLAPTRELADQVYTNLKAYAKHTPLRCACVFGGMDMAPQKAELRTGVDLLVATPGRLLDHLEAKTVNLGQVQFVVLDEADRMLDIGFLPDLQRILGFLPKQRTTLLFSATFSTEIKRLAQSYLQNPLLVEVARPNATATNVEQRVYQVEEDDKRATLVQLLRDNPLPQVIVFVNSRLGAGRLTRLLERDGIKAAAMHGDKSQAERLTTLEAFKRGEIQALVATDVAARGLDIAELPGVVNYDVPFSAEDYVHRIGRTGRAGASGLAITLATARDARSLADIEKLIKRQFEKQTVSLERAPRPRRDADETREHRIARAPRALPSDTGASAPVTARVSRSSRQDPWFDKPYEADPNAQPVWEAASASPGSGARSTSSNIRPRRKIAALLGGSDPK